MAMPSRRTQAARQRLLRRPPQELLVFDRQPLVRAHLFFLLIACSYIGSHYPHAAAMAVVVAVAGFAAELVPAYWRRWFAAEIVALGVGLLTCWWAWSIDGSWPTDAASDLHDSAFHGWIRLVIILWLMVPSRPGFLRFLGLLIGLELLVADRAQGPAASGLVQVALVPIALAALAIDAHLRIGCARPPNAQLSHVRRAPFWSWSAVALLLASGLAGGSTIAVTQLKQALRSPPSGPGGPGADLPRGQGGLPETIGIDDSRWSDQDSAVVARLKAPEQPAGTYYLRALTAPRLVIDPSDTADIHWRTDPDEEFPLGDDFSLHDGHDPQIVQLQREADGSDMVLRPDGSCRVELHNMVGDPDGNLSRSGLGERSRFYPVDLGAISYPPSLYSTRRLDAYLEVDARIRRMLKDRLRDELQVWRQQSTLIAGEAIKNWLHERCRYSLHDLPAAPNRYAGGLMRFLFDPVAGQRGHCQYFATAAALLLRVAGHPARCVVGFSSDEVRPEGIVFRSLGAHAWVEVLANSGGAPRWYRLEVTPSGHLAQRAEGLDLSGDPFANERRFEDASDWSQEDTRDSEHTGGDWPVWSVVVLLVSGFAVVVVLARRRGGVGDLRIRTLDRQTEGLLGLAEELNITVAPHSSLCCIVRAIEQRSGIELEEILQAHLRARFDQGPLPPPWPLSAIRAAARERQAITAGS